MAINVSPGGLISAKVLARQAAQQEVNRHSDARQAEALQTEDTSPGAEIQRFVQSTDEMSAAMAQFRNRRDYDKKAGELSSSFERVLDEDILPKAQKILQTAKLQNVTADELLRQAQKLFPDPSDLVLVLRELLKRTKLSEAVRKKLQVLLKEVEAQADPKMLKAGINCALKARLFGKSMNLQPGLLRASYRHFIQSESDEIDTYSDWVSSYGYQRRLIVLDYIEGALLSDIDSLDPSCSHLEFGYLLGRLSQLKSLRSADLSFIGKLVSSSSISSFNVAESVWLLLMFSLLKEPHAVDAILSDILGDEILLKSHKEHSVLLYELYIASKTLPSTLFFDPSWREDLLDSLRNMADIAYRNELIEQRRRTN
ncbi:MULTISPECIES: YopN/LcrE/InvE/MxiC type III secretion system gatekeeper [unclassified Providencia]|uniref:YopN/LcrE/InvE/MxiC type III secretion system gatekeeper n=1 Tax=unclassified Providencia TaxID=2633465 RepID=UPI0012B640DD|nr:MULTISPECIES: YopN/LcrE/InvE/MxiC type III secretion system gatekeeper [unclassified Providencia]MTC22083.1 YopN/LcrE/InvE/MxiC type III secretion system gatekeeper [Providencia sp. wls1938]